MLFIRMNIKDLRKHHPDWTWRAEHYGMGYCYEGSKGGRKVSVVAFGELSEWDEVFTRWMVEEDNRFIDYATWCLKNGGVK